MGKGGVGCCQTVSRWRGLWPVPETWWRVAYVMKSKDGGWWKRLGEEFQEGRSVARKERGLRSRSEELFARGRFCTAWWRNPSIERVRAG